MRLRVPKPFKHTIVSLLSLYRCYHCIAVITVSLLSLYHCYHCIVVITVSLLSLYRCYHCITVITVSLLSLYPCYHCIIVSTVLSVIKPCIRSLIPAFHPSICSLLGFTFNCVIFGSYSSSI